MTSPVRIIVGHSEFWFALRMQLVLSSEGVNVSRVCPHTHTHARVNIHRQLKHARSNIHTHNSCMHAKTYIHTTHACTRKHTQTQLPIPKPHFFFSSFLALSFFFLFFWGVGGVCPIQLSNAVKDSSGLYFCLHFCTVFYRSCHVEISFFT